MNDAAAEITSHLELINAGLGLALVIIQVTLELSRQRRRQLCSVTERRSKRRERYASEVMRRRVVQGVLATLVLALAAGIHFDLLTINFGVHKQELTTGAGDMRELVVGDHTLNVNENTALSITEGPFAIRIAMDRGEAAFLTGKTNRPLSVTTPHVSVRSDNGLFGLRILADATEITTSRDGNDTTIDCQSESGHKTLKLHADQSVRISRHCELQLGRMANAEAPELSPREELRFRNVRLEDAISDFNLYYQRPIRLQGESLLDQRISGAFDPLDQQSLLEYLRMAYGARAAPAHDGSMTVIGRSNLTAARPH